ncbi:MAG: hypothetical protein P8X79_16340 [Reinekea sp.]
MIPLCFPKISMNLWVPPAIFEKQIEIKLLHPASTLESRIQVIFYRRQIQKEVKRVTDALCEF